jgi:hypothetical protein
MTLVEPVDVLSDSTELHESFISFLREVSLWRGHIPCQLDLFPHELHAYWLKNSGVYDLVGNDVVCHGEI